MVLEGIKCGVDKVRNELSFFVWFWYILYIVKLYWLLVVFEIGRIFDIYLRKIFVLLVFNKFFSSYKNLYGRLIKLLDCVLLINKILLCFDVMFLFY